MDHDDEDDTDDSSLEMPDETPQEESVEEGTVMFSYNAAEDGFEYVGPEHLGPMPNIRVGSVVSVLYMAVLSLVHPGRTNMDRVRAGTSAGTTSRGGHARLASAVARSAATSSRVHARVVRASGHASAA